MVELKDLIAVPNIAERLRRPAKTDKVLGPRKDSWCEFHEAFGHHIGCHGWKKGAQGSSRPGKFCKRYVLVDIQQAAVVS